MKKECSGERNVYYQDIRTAIATAKTATPERDGAFAVVGVDTEGDRLTVIVAEVQAGLFVITAY